MRKNTGSTGQAMEIMTLCLFSFVNFVDVISLIVRDVPSSLLPVWLRSGTTNVTYLQTNI